ncbi:hypothetical protein HNR42_003134 [Deinobacterium chartae]|uniref:Tubulin like n=1 Tax=Deinobacterium chartae TaxID=521158 RepID=A0A841I3R2_9DEIO|nr:tubulin-like doman-containing protein [Deinobacterium chartae]MBB6099676.1 hypothetical protein [Deinobacterium chartae]
MTTVHYLKRTVLIGLGGTGKAALLNAKRKYLETYGEVPPLVSFLVIDTTNDNASSLSATLPNGSTVPVKLKANELLHIEARGASKLPQVNDEIREWFPKRAELKANILSGAGQVRALGRLALFANARLVYETLRNRLAEARDYTRERPQQDSDVLYQAYTPHLTVCVAGSIAGGTGSGTFLDVAFLLRDLLKDEDQLFSYLLLPDIYTSRPGTQNVEANAYGALKELDHCMSLESTWSYSFGGRRIDVSKKPFDMVFLINRQNRAGKTFNDPADLADLMGFGMFLAGGPLGKEQADIFDNIVVQLAEGQGRYYGKTAHYASFGAAELAYDPRPLQQLSGLGRARALIETQRRSRSAVTLDLTAQRALEVREGADVPNTVAAPDPDREAQMWPSVRSDLLNIRETARTETQKLLDAEVRGWEDHLRPTLSQFFNNGSTVLDLHAALDVALVQLREVRSAAKERVRSAEEALTTDLEATDSNVRAARPAASSGFFGRGRREAAAPVLDRKRLRSLHSKAVKCGQEEAKLSLIERYITAMEAEHRRLQNLLDRFDQLRTTHVQTPDLRPQPQRSRPYTLTLPTTSTLSGLPRAAVGTETVPVTLDDLLTRPEDVLRAQRGSGDAIDLEAWLVTALGQPEAAREIDRVFRELNDLSAPSWDYQDAWVSNPAVSHLEQVQILGVNDKNRTALRSDRLEDVFAGRMHQLQFVSTGDPNRVLFYKIEAAVPAFALAGIDGYREKYLQLSAGRSFHLRADWENLPDLTPLPSDREAARVWSQGRVLGRIRSEAGSYQYLSNRDGSERWYTLGSAFETAFFAFRSDFFLFKEIEQRIRRQWHEPRNDREATALKVSIERLQETTARLAQDEQRPGSERRLFELHGEVLAELMADVSRGTAFQQPDDFEPVVLQ